MPKYSKLTIGLRRWLFPLIDRYDWGEFDNDLGTPRPNLSSKEIEVMMNFPGPMYWGSKKLTSTALEAHLEYDRTLYYRSTRSGEFVLLNLDIDAHDASVSEEDAERVARYISKNLHRRAYYEQSTNGKGRHLYLCVHRKSVSAIAFKRTIARYLEALKVILKNGRFKASVDRVCGVPTVVTRTVSEIGVRQRVIHPGDCGVLSKVPRLPFGDQSLKDLIEAPVVTMKSILKVIERANAIKEKAAHAAKPRGIVPYITSNILTSAGQNLEEMKGENDAFRKMIFAHKLFVEQKKRKPVDPEELRDFYEQNGLHTSHDLRRRRFHRAKSVWTFFQHARYDAKKNSYHFDLSRQLKAIEAHVNPSHYEGVKIDKGRSVTNEDLAVVLYLVELNSIYKPQEGRRKYTLGNDAIIAMFAVLRAAECSRRGCNTTKSVACKQILANAGLTSVVDDTWFHGGKYTGICKKFAVGVVHPLYEKYAAAQRKSAEEEAEEERYIDSILLDGVLQRVGEDYDPFAEGGAELTDDSLGSPSPAVRAEEGERVAIGEPLAVVGACKHFRGPIEGLVGQVPDFDEPFRVCPDVDSG